MLLFQKMVLVQPSVKGTSIPKAIGMVLPPASDIDFNLTICMLFTPFEKLPENYDVFFKNEKAENPQNTLLDFPGHLFTLT